MSGAPDITEILSGVTRSFRWSHLIDITHIWRYDRQIWGTQSPEVSLLHELGGPQVREARLIRMIDNRGMANPVFREVISAISNFVTAAKDFTSLQKFSVGLIACRLPYYNWVGFYMLDPGDDSILVLGPFHGAPTDHVRIPVTEGICGAAVAQGETVIVEDVSSDPRYLSCSIETKSEIVVPIRVKGKIRGEIDIDSHLRNAFGAEDRSFLEECAAVFGQFLERQDKSAARAVAAK